MQEQSVLINNEAVPVSQTQTTFLSKGALAAPTPNWAKWMFRATFIITTVAAFIIASDPGITDSLKVRIGVYLKGLDMIIYFFSKAFGINVKDDVKMGD